MKSPLITMTAVTGKSTKEKINKYMISLKNNGVDQLMIYPRSGCELEYLSDEWFAVIGHFIHTAEALDMNVWLYDEYNWPSGDAGGLVTQNKDFRLKSIITKGSDAGKINVYSQHNAALFGEKFFPDLLSFDAVNYFIKSTHEKYYEKFGAYFGNIIKGIFTDEPSIGYSCTDTSIPYYYGIEKDYNNVFERDFNDDMNFNYELFCENVFRLISDRFNKCYIKQINNWCSNHKIMMTGHLLCDDSPFDTIRHNGSILKNLSSFKLPGIDEINTSLLKTELENGTGFTLLGTIEYASGESGAMAELFAL